MSFLAGLVGLRGFHSYTCLFLLSKLFQFVLVEFFLNFFLFIGASLSEPYTSETALRTCVCIYLASYACLFVAIYP